MFDLTGNRAYNVDCMELMREVPDKYFDLAVCDPPYGDGSLQTVQVERERERKIRRYNRFGGRLDQYKQPQIRRGGWHGKQKYRLGSQEDTGKGETCVSQMERGDMLNGVSGTTKPAKKS